MRVVGYVIQILGAVTILGGIALGVVSIMSNGLAVIIGGVIGGMLLIGIGTAFDTLANIAADVRRSADALERLKRTNANQ